MPLNIKTGGGEKLPPRLVIVGEQKVGKTTFASRHTPDGEFRDDVVIVPTEDGCSQLPVSVAWNENGAVHNTWRSILETVIGLGTEDHGKKWVAFDTGDGLEALCRDSIIGKNPDGTSRPFKDISDYLAYGRGEKVNAMEFKILLDYLDRLRQKKKMGIIILCHDKVQSVSSPATGDYAKFTGRMERATWSVLKDWADQIGFAQHDFSVLHANDSEGKRGKAKSMGDGVFIRFKGHAAIDVGCNAGFEMDETVPLVWDEYRAALAKNYTKKGEAK